jgi:DNA polymerase-3 subunit alpha/error-prone DNA polymerase
MYLNCHSFHSLRYGTIPVDALVAMGSACGVKAIALTDINTVTGIYEFYQGCKAIGIKAIVGMELRHDHKLHYIALAKNRSGLGEINRLRTKHNLEGTPLPQFAPDFKDVAVIYPIDNLPDSLREFEYIGIRPENLTLLIRKEWAGKRDKMVILQPVTFRNKKEYNLHRILRAIDLNILGSKLTPDDYCAASETMADVMELTSKYYQYPEIVENTEALMALCNFEYEFKVPRNKKHYTKDSSTDLELLTRLAHQGMVKRYGIEHEEAQLRVEKELKVIHELNFSGYFLITWDIIRYSNSMGFLHIGRGSGANSIIAYCLGITDICPLELDLYFERFLNLNRKSPPDFDIDWSWKERDTILEYVFTRYGADHVAFCGTNVEFKYKSIFREVGKVFGLPKEELDALSGTAMDQHDKNEIVRKVHYYGKLMEKYPNQRSMHSCGILISEDPITDFTALEIRPKGFPIVQFDMHVAEEVGFDKFDILSQRGIGHIDEAVQLIKQNRGIDVNIRDTTISKNDPTCNEYLGHGRTMGCFYIESPAMRGLLRRLKCDDYKILVAASSIIRPGVAQSGMMKEYIFRHNHPDKFEYFHPVFQEQLGETYGIMVYQEDVIKIALHYGGLAAADGDILRRAMSGKGRSLEALQRVKDNFFASCAAKGHPEELSAEIYRQIESFAGYSFCKAHSASYAVESYQSLYLKVHYPVEFMVAVINNQGGFYRTEVYIHEARMSGGIIHNPCINKSGVETTIYGRDVYLGFMLLKGLKGDVAQKIVEERDDNGDYISMEDFINRVPIGMEGLQLLIYIGALRCTGKTKNELLVNAMRIMTNYKPVNRNLMLLPEPVKEYKLPVLKRSPFEDAFDEIELLGFPLSVTPFNLLQTRYRGDIMARDLVKYHRQTVRMLAYLISRKHVPTKMGAMYFGTWIDTNGELFDTAHFTTSLAAYPFKGGGCYLLQGTVEVDYHFPTITISKMAKMPFMADPRYAETDDRRFKTQELLREDVSMTDREPYPQEQEINLPRHKMVG